MSNPEKRNLYDKAVFGIFQKTSFSNQEAYDYYKNARRKYKTKGYLNFYFCLFFIYFLLDSFDSSNSSELNKFNENQKDLKNQNTKEGDLGEFSSYKSEYIIIKEKFNKKLKKKLKKYSKPF